MGQKDDFRRSTFNKGNSSTSHIRDSALLLRFSSPDRPLPSFLDRALPPSLRHATHSKPTSKRPFCLAGVTTLLFLPAVVLFARLLRQVKRIRSLTFLLLLAPLLASIVHPSTAFFPTFALHSLRWRASPGILRSSPSLHPLPPARLLSLGDLHFLHSRSLARFTRPRSHLSVLFLACSLRSLRSHQMPPKKAAIAAAASKSAKKKKWSKGKVKDKVRSNSHPPTFHLCSASF